MTQLQQDVLAAVKLQHVSTDAVDNGLQHGVTRRCFVVSNPSSSLLRQSVSVRAFGDSELAIARADVPAFEGFFHFM